MRFIFVSVFVATAAFAFEPGGHRGPPAEALAACNGLSNGTACGFTLDGKNLTGTCRNGPGGDAAACMPEGMNHRGLPQEAVTACSGQSSGATCSFTHGERTVEGTCRSGPRGGDTLACAPTGGPGAHRGPPQEALTACASSSAGASCSVSMHGRTLNGTCVAGPEGKALACMPARP